MSEVKTPTDAEPSEPEPEAEQATTPQSPGQPLAQQTLRTWITTYDAATYSARYYQLNLLANEARKLIADRTSEEYTVHEALEELNISQRGYVLNQVSRLGATLIFVDIWKKERIITVFGKVELAFLVWVTSGGVDDGAEFPRFVPPPPTPPFPPPPPTVCSQVVKGRAESEAGDEPIDDADDEVKSQPISLTDAAERKFIFPYELVKTWREMHNLILEAFPMDDHIKTFIEKGHYDLIDASNDDIILPSVWRYIVKPGLLVKMRLWAISGTPPPPVVQLLAGNVGSDIRPWISQHKPEPESKISSSSGFPHPVSTETEVVDVETNKTSQAGSACTTVAAG